MMITTADSTRSVREVSLKRFSKKSGMVIASSAISV